MPFFCNDGCQSLCTAQQCLAVVLNLQIWNHLSADFCNALIREQSLESAPNFDSVLALRKREKNQEASIIFFVPNSPFIEKPQGIVFD